MVVLGVCVTPPVQSFRKDRLCVCSVPDTADRCLRDKQWSGSLPSKVFEFSGGDWLSLLK